MRLGALILPTQSWRQTATAFREIERVGYAVAYVSDRLTCSDPRAGAQGWLADAQSTLGAAAAITKHVEIGTLASSAAIRNPVALARFASTVQDISGGRMVLGIGAGVPADYLADRGQHVEQSELANRFREVAEGVRAVWTGDRESQGRHACGRLHAPFSGLNTVGVPRGVAPPYLVVAAQRPRGMAVAARVADGWSTYGGPGLRGLPPDRFWPALAAHVAQFDRICAAQGRDPSTVRKSLLLGGRDGSPTATVASLVTAAARAAGIGFHELVVCWNGTRPADPAVHEEALLRVRHQHPVGAG